MTTIQVLQARGGREITDEKTGEGYYYSLRKGDVVKIRDDEAKRWIDAGQAQEVEIADAPDLREIMSTPRQVQPDARTLAHMRNGVLVRRPRRKAAKKAAKK